MQGMIKKTGTKDDAPRKGGASRDTKCHLVDTFWTFFPAFQRWAEARTEDERLTPQRIRILAILQEKGPQIMSNLRDDLGVSATNITALVDALERDGLVCRKPHPEDRRATLIEVTAKVGGCKETTTSCMAYAERVGELFEVLDESEGRELLRMVQKLRDHLNQKNA